MSNIDRYIPKLNDRDVLRAFESVHAKYSERSAQLQVSDTFGALSPSEIEKARKLHGHLLSQVVLRIGSGAWSWTRLRAHHNDPKSAEYDKLSFGWNQQQAPYDRDLVSVVTSDIDRAIAKPLIASEDSQTSSSLHSQKEIVAALQGAVAELLTDATHHRQQLENAFLERERELETRVSEQAQLGAETLAAKEQRLEAENTARKESLEKQELALKELQRKLDDRNNTHVRREIRASLLKLAQDRLANFSVSRETRVQYWMVHGVALFGIVTMIWASLSYGAEIVQILTSIPPKNVPLAMLVALGFKSGLLAVGALTLGAWYLRWLNRWLQRIADAEFKLQQFRLDIERASWLAETVLEWRSASTEPFPDLLADRLSAGLFSAKSSEVDDPKTPVEHLANAVFGAAASAKLRIGDQEILLDRKSMKAMG